MKKLRKLTLRPTTIRHLVVLTNVRAGWQCTDTCGACDSYVLTCQGNTCTTP